MAEPAEPVNVMCPECGTIIQVRDLRLLLLTMHQANDCAEVSALFARSGE